MQSLKAREYWRYEFQQTRRAIVTWMGVYQTSQVMYEDVLLQLLGCLKNIVRNKNIRSLLIVFPQAKASRFPYLPGLFAVESSLERIPSMLQHAKLNLEAIEQMFSQHRLYVTSIVQCDVFSSLFDLVLLSDRVLLGQETCLLMGYPECLYEVFPFAAGAYRLSRRIGQQPTQDVLQAHGIVTHIALGKVCPTFDWVPEQNLDVQNIHGDQHGWQRTRFFQWYHRLQYKIQQTLSWTQSSQAFPMGTLELGAIPEKTTYSWPAQISTLLNHYRNKGVTYGFGAEKRYNQLRLQDPACRLSHELVQQLAILDPPSQTSMGPIKIHQFGPYHVTQERLLQKFISHPGVRIRLHHESLWVGLSLQQRLEQYVHAKRRQGWINQRQAWQQTYCMTFQQLEKHGPALRRAEQGLTLMLDRLEDFEELEQEKLRWHQRLALCAPGMLAGLAHVQALPTDFFIGSFPVASQFSFHLPFTVTPIDLVELRLDEQAQDDGTRQVVRMLRQFGMLIAPLQLGAESFSYRLAYVMLNEACHLLSEGYGVEVIDHALHQLGFPLGPFQYADSAGIDILYALGLSLSQQIESYDHPSNVLRTLVENEWIGKQVHDGFYRYGKLSLQALHVNRDMYKLIGLGKSRRKKINPSLLQERILYRLLNEVVRMVEKKKVFVRDANWVPVVALGFPSGTGGVCQYINHVGCPKIVHKLEHLTHLYGERFMPADALASHARRGQHRLWSMQLLQAESVSKQVHNKKLSE